MTSHRLFAVTRKLAKAVRLNLTSRTYTALSCATFLICSTGIGFSQSTQDQPYLPSPVRMASTVPSNGDVNPYGVAYIGNNFLAGSGPLKPGDILVSNFNNKQNLQGTGTTIVRIPANGSAPTVFFQGSAHPGLSTGLATLQEGFILVCSLPTADGTAATAKAGSLMVINNQGTLIQNFSSSNIDGPWDMTVVDNGSTANVFISDALYGGVIRIDFSVTPKGLTELDHYIIASGYKHQADPAALFDAPTGLVFDKTSGLLYVASTLDNMIFSVSDALTRTTTDGTGSVVYNDQTHLHGALAMAEAPNGDLLVTNNDVINADPNQPSEIVEFTKAGEFVKEISVDPNLGGSFGLNVSVNQQTNTSVLAAVDDNTASLTIWTLPL